MNFHCADCVEFYHTCVGWPDGPDAKDFDCADFHRLPNVGVNGQTGQGIPPSRMGGRTDPRARRNKDTEAPKAQEPRVKRRRGEVSQTRTEGLGRPPTQAGSPAHSSGDQIPRPGRSTISLEPITTDIWNYSGERLCHKSRALPPTK